MPLPLKILRIRTLSAIVFVVVMLCGLFINPLSFLLLFSFIHFGCWQEFIDLSSKAYNLSSLEKKIFNLRIHPLTLIGFMGMLCYADPSIKLGNASLKGIGWYGLLISTVVFCVRDVLLNKHLEIKGLLVALSGLYYISVPWILMMDLFQSTHVVFENETLPRWHLPFLVIGTIWLNDTAAYLVGTFFGRRPLSPISPQKTWEGTVWGAVLAIAFSTYFGNILLKMENWMLLVILTTVISIAGIVGDLLESKFKRMAGVKDSGSILPGHGGFLDRFDSMLFAIPIAWLAIKLLFWGYPL